MTVEDKIKRDCAEMLREREPHTVEDICLLAAELCVKHAALPRGDIQIKEAAKGMMIGLFGEAYEDACEHQREIWGSICEDAMRKAIEKRRLALN